MRRFNPQLSVREPLANPSSGGVSKGFLRLAQIELVGNEPTSPTLIESSPLDLEAFILGECSKSTFTYSVIGKDDNGVTLMETSRKWKDYFLR
jgi:hypothetical protein